MIEFVIGSALAASAGLNAWMPLFLLGLADRFLPAVELPQAWSWISSDVALWVMGILLVLEIVADKIPAVDSINDIIQTALRPAAGGVAFSAGAGAQTAAVTDPAALFSESSAGLWISLGVGVVIALAVHAAKALARPVLNAATGGLAAPLLSTGEDAASFGLAAAAIIVPIVAALLLIGLIVVIVVVLRRRSRIRREKRERAQSAPSPAAR